MNRLFPPNPRSELLNGRRKTVCVLDAMTTLSDSELVATVRGASPSRDDAFRTLVRRYQPMVYAVALSLVQAGAVAVPADLPARLEALSRRGVGNVWLWALAHAIFADERYKGLALAARLPRKPLRRGFALLRLHQLTGDLHWIANANRQVARAPNIGLPALDTALLVVELKAPEMAVLPPFLFPFSGLGAKMQGGRTDRPTDRDPAAVAYRSV